MNQHKYLIFAFFTLALFAACEKDECNQVYGCIDINALNFNQVATIDDGSCEYELLAPFNLSFNTYVNQDQFVLNDALYDDYMGRKFRVELLKFYFSNCFLEKQDGTLVPIVDVTLVNYASAMPISIDLDVETGNYINLHFAIGLDSLMNASDPIGFENSHPLSISNNTYWSWASKYKFFMLEGRVDSQSDGVPNAAFSYHSGFNSLYREITLPLDEFEISSDGGSISLELNLESVLYGEAGIIDFVSAPFSHSENNYEIVEIISNNLLNAFNINE